MPQSVTVASHPALGIFKNRKTEFQQFNEALLLEARVGAMDLRIAITELCLSNYQIEIVISLKMIAMVVNPKIA